MEGPQPPKRTATVRCDDDQESVCDGVRMDGKRQHQGILEGGPQCGSIGTRAFSFEMLITNNDVIIIAWRYHKGADLYA